MIKLFSKKQVLLTAIIAGPLAASYLISKNYSNIRLRKASNVAKISGFISAFVVYIAVIILANILLINTGFFYNNLAIGYTLVVLLFFVVQLAYTGIFSFTNSRITKKSVFELVKNNKNVHSINQVAPFFLLGILITSYLFISGPPRFFFFLIYLLPNAYLYHHITLLITSVSLKQIFTILFILIIAIFPLIMTINEPSNILIYKYVQLIAFYYLPVLLYLFLFYLLTDLTFQINRIFRFIPKAITSNINFKRYVLYSILLVTGIFLIIGINNFNTTEIENYTIDIPKKDSKLEHLKIAMTADIHFSEITSENFVKQLVEKINSINPDIVLLPGDILDVSTTSSKMKSLEELCKKINSKYGVFAVDGNHEIYSGSYRFDFFDNANISLLQDTAIFIDSSFYILGRKDRHDKERKSIEDLLQLTSINLPTILLDHQPYNLNMAYNTKIDIQLSGHTHHGQLFPFNYITKAIYEISWGYKKIRNTHFFITCGAQGWGPQVKTSSHSELMEIDVNFK